MPGHNPDKAACRAANASGSLYGWLNKRQDFLRAAKGMRAHNSAFVMQTIPSPVPEDPSDGTSGASLPRFGLTVSKKNGNAVKRNRIKRRLRAALSQAFQGNITAKGGHPSDAQAMDARFGYDYVVAARPEALTRSFGSLVNGLQDAVTTVHSGIGKRRRHTSNSSPARTQNAPVK